MKSSEWENAFMQALPWSSQTLQKLKVALTAGTTKVQILENYLAKVLKEDSARYPSTIVRGFQNFLRFGCDQNDLSTQELDATTSKLFSYRVVEVLLQLSDLDRLEKVAHPNPALNTPSLQMMYTSLQDLNGFGFIADRLSDLKSLVNIALAILTPANLKCHDDEDAENTSLGNSALRFRRMRRTHNNAEYYALRANFDTAIFHLGFLLEGHDDFPRTLAELKKYLADQGNTDISETTLELSQLRGPLHVAYFVSSLCLLIPVRLDARPPGKVKCFQGWRTYAAFGPKPLGVQLLEDAIDNTLLTCATTRTSSSKALFALSNSLREILPLLDKQPGSSNYFSRDRLSAIAKATAPITIQQSPRLEEAEPTQPRLFTAVGDHQRPEAQEPPITSVMSASLAQPDVHEPGNASPSHHLPGWAVLEPIKAPEVPQVHGQTVVGSQPTGSMTCESVEPPNPSAFLVEQLFNGTLSPVPTPPSSPFPSPVHRSKRLPGRHSIDSVSDGFGDDLEALALPGSYEDPIQRPSHSYGRNNDTGDEYQPGEGRRAKNTSMGKNKKAEGLANSATKPEVFIPPTTAKEGTVTTSRKPSPSFLKALEKLRRAEDAGGLHFRQIVMIDLTRDSDEEEDQAPQPSMVANLAALSLPSSSQAIQLTIPYLKDPLSYVPNFLDQHDTQVVLRAHTSFQQASAIRPRTCVAIVTPTVYSGDSAAILEKLRHSHLLVAPNNLTNANATSILDTSFPWGEESALTPDIVEILGQLNSRHDLIDFSQSDLKRRRTGTTSEIMQCSIPPGTPLLCTSYTFRGDFEQTQSFQSEAAIWEQMERIKDGLKRDQWPGSVVRFGVCTSGRTYRLVNAPAGMGCFVVLKAGLELWYIATPLDNASPQTAWGSFLHVLSDPAGWNIEPAVLTPGARLILQPGAVAMAVSPKPSVLVGGYFISTSALRCTAYDLLQSFALGNVKKAHMETTFMFLCQTMVFLRSYFLDRPEDLNADHHFPNLTSMDGILDVIILGCILELGNVLNGWSFLGTNEYERVRLIYARQRSRELIRWLFATYQLENSVGDYIDGKVTLFWEWLSQIAAVLYSQRKQAEASGIKPKQSSTELDLNLHQCFRLEPQLLRKYVAKQEAQDCKTYAWIGQTFKITARKRPPVNISSICHGINGYTFEDVWVGQVPMDVELDSATSQPSDVPTNKPVALARDNERNLKRKRAVTIIPPSKKHVKIS